MRIAFRADASARIGYGHLMRCLTLANVVQKRGCAVRVLTRHIVESLRGLLEAARIEHVSLPHCEDQKDRPGLTYSSWLGTTQHNDATDVAEALSDGPWDGIVVDSYSLDAAWESVVRERVTRVMAIDDLADRRHDADILLNQNLLDDPEVRYQNLVPPESRLLLGPHYALLRPEFARLRQATAPREGSVRRVLVSYGGVDAENLTGRTLEALARFRQEHVTLEADVVVGSGCPQLEQVTARCRVLGFGCHVETDRMAELMSRADLAIGAAGSTSWERCSLGLGTICVATAENQVAIAQGLARRGSIILLGGPEDLTEASLLQVLRRLRSFPAEVGALSEAAWEMVDGLGAERVADALLEVA